MAKAQKDYLKANREKFLQELIELLSIPSISTLSEHKNDLLLAAGWLEQKLAAIGFPVARIIETEGHPLVYAEWLAHKEQPTLLIYGHYDVQPVDPVAEWHSPPFQPTIRDGNIYCRGACDDKGQLMLVLAALEAWASVDGGLPINIKLLLEGEEEAGGASVERFVKEHPEQLAADAVLICDTHMVHPEQPSIIIGLRGILYCEIEVTGAKNDLHSGSYGGVAPNPIHALTILISRIKGEDGQIHIPELMEVVGSSSTAEKRFWQEDPLNIHHALCQEMGVEQLVGEEQYPPLERLGLRPTFEVHGIRGGFTGEGAKTVIPAKATAKVSLRLPAHLDPDEVFQWFQKAVQHHMPSGHGVQVTNLHGGKGFHISPENPYVRAGAEALESVYGKEPVFMREGGSIPIAQLFDEVLQTPVVLMGFGLPDDAIHAPNEKFSLEQFAKGMETVAELLEKLVV